MTSVKILIASLLSLLLLACSSIPVSQDYLPGTDFSSLSSYRWNPALLEKEQQIENNNPLVNLRIHQAIDRKLAELGYRLTDSEDADFVVNYQTRVQPRVESDGTTGTIAIGFGNIGHFGAFGIQTGNIISEKDEATLMIDIIDAATGKLLWRGVSTRYSDIHTSPDNLTETINRHVDAILNQFPPGK